MDIKKQGANKIFTKNHRFDESMMYIFSEEQISVATRDLELKQKEREA